MSLNNVDAADWSSTGSEGSFLSGGERVEEGEGRVEGEGGEGDDGRDFFSFGTLTRSRW